MRKSALLCTFMFALSASGAVYDVTCGGVDDTSAIQTAINTAAAAGGGIVRLPTGTCVAGGTGGSTPTAIGLKSNVILEGFGAGSVLRHKSGTQYLIYTDSQSNAGVSTNIRNIAIRDLTLYGRSETDGFSEHNHLVSLNGVSDVLVANVVFKAFQGDGLIAMSHSTYDDSPTRHNERLIVDNSVFDGVNKANRCGVAFGDCTGCTVKNSLFTRTTTSTMPGSIDIEPDLSWQIIRDIKIIRNRFIDIGGNSGAVSIALYQTGDVPRQNFLISENDFETTSFGIVFGTGGNTSSSQDPLAAVVEKNRFNVTTRQAILISGVKGVRVEGNAFLNTTHAGLYVGRDPSGYLFSAHDVAVRNNLFYKCSTTEPYAMVIYTVERLAIENNTFFDCGTSSSVETLVFPSGSSTDLRVKGNSVVNLTSRSTTKFTTAGISYTFSPSTSTYFDNRIPDAFGNDIQTTTTADAGLRVSSRQAKPACDSSVWGLQWYTQGASGTKDTLQVCAKDASNAYAWRTLY